MQYGTDQITDKEENTLKLKLLMQKGKMIQLQLKKKR